MSPLVGVSGINLYGADEEMLLGVNDPVDSNFGGRFNLEAFACRACRNANRRGGSLGIYDDCSSSRHPWSKNFVFFTFFKFRRSAVFEGSACFKRTCPCFDSIDFALKRGIGGRPFFRLFNYFNGNFRFEDIPTKRHS